MKSLRCQAIGIVNWKLFPVLLALVLSNRALATDPFFDNTGVSVYTIPGNPPPMIDTMAFANEATAEFELNFSAYTPYPELYETWNTLNFTNLGLMVANSPVTTNFAFFFGLTGSFGSGFNFDRQTTNQISRAIAGSFYNSGNIRCDSTLDGNNIFSINDFNGFIFTFYTITSLGQFKVWATNINNPGNIDVGTGGLIQMKGQNVDLSGGLLNIEPQLNSSLTLFNLFGFFNFNFNPYSTIPFDGTGGAGVNTNFFWDPAFDLTTTTATASYPDNLVISNLVAYTQDDIIDSNNVVHRAVFIQNSSPDGNTTASVYFDPLNSFSPFGLFYPGCVNVAWSANTIDPATGAPVNNYLYLTDDYILGATTNASPFVNAYNNGLFTGLPNNFLFTQVTTPVLTGPAAPTLVVNYPNIVLTNPYSFFNGSIAASTVSTNASGFNPSGTITNLPSAVKITASNTLNLAFSTISGANYLSLNCTNQFQGSPGAAISAPFSDIALGVTNGFLTMSNVLMANIPNYSGTVQAWSTRFITVDTTSVGTNTVIVTNDYRVLIVFSAIEPSTDPWIQHLYLHGTNDLTVSDHLNVYGSMYSDAKVLTLNTNLTGVGATSLDGEFRWENAATFNANSGAGVQQMPNLLWVTNYGVFRALNNAYFGNAGTPQFTVTPGTPAVPATATLVTVGTNAVTKDVVTIGASQYIFVNTLTNAIANQVKRATTGDASLNNLIAAVNHGAGAGTTYSTATTANPLVTAGTLVSHSFTVTARIAGTAGNAITTVFTPATASVNFAWADLGTLANGIDAIPPITNYTSFNNHSLIADQGTAIWTTFFDNDGTITNGTGSFILHCGFGMLGRNFTNSGIFAGGDVLLTATNTPGMGVNGLIISNTMIQASNSLTIVAPNLTDTGVTNGNIWALGANSGGGPADSGFNILIKPPVGDLLGTTVTNIAPFHKTIYNVWAGTDRGISNSGYTNDLAVGHLVLDSWTSNTLAPIAYVFNGAGTNNALYVDLLELRDGARLGNPTNNYNFPWLKINTNMYVYYADARINGVSVAEAIDNQSKIGANGGRLRWIYSYAGYFSSTNLITTNSDGSTFTNTVNTALAQSPTIDSDGDGIPNATDPTPFFLASEINFHATVTNLPPNSVKVQWLTPPNATNFVYYTTNLTGTNSWLPFTNFNNWYYGGNVAVANPLHGNSFRSPQAYVKNPLLPDNSVQTNVWLFDTITNVPHYYKVTVRPWVDFAPN